MENPYKYICLESVDSTNNYLKQHAELRDSFTTVHALEQTSGRGRHGRTWFSGNSSIAFSFVYTPDQSVNLSAITLCIGLALRKAIAAFSKKEALVKWPNDIVFNEKKIGGILTELIHEQKKILIIGIGLNIDTKSLPDDIQKTSSGLSEIIAGEIIPRDMINAIIAEMNHYLPFYTFPLNPEFLDEYNKFCLKGIHNVSVKSNGETIKKIFNIHGINQNGHLLVEDENEITAIQDIVDIEKT